MDFACLVTRVIHVLRGVLRLDAVLALHLRRWVMFVKAGMQVIVLKSMGSNLLEWMWSEYDPEW